MAIVLSPIDGLRNTSTYPSNPSTEAAARDQIQGVIDQVVNQVNTQLVDHQTGSVTISGVTFTAIVTKHMIEIVTKGTSSALIDQDIVIPGVDLTTLTTRKELFTDASKGLIVQTRDYNAVYFRLNSGNFTEKAFITTKY